MKLEKVCWEKRLEEILLAEYWNGKIRKNKMSAIISPMFIRFKISLSLFFVLLRLPPSLSLWSDIVECEWIVMVGMKPKTRTRRIR